MLIVVLLRNLPFNNNQDTLRNMVPEPSQELTKAKENKALTAWKKIKSSLGFLKKTLGTYQEEHNDLIHGINFKLKLSHPHVITDAHYLSKRNLFITIGGGKAIFFSDTGNKTAEIPFVFDHIKPLFDAQKFIAWQNGSNKVHLLNSTLEIIHTINCVCTVYLVCFNTKTNEVIIVCNGFISSWVFQNGLRHLVRKISCTRNEFSQSIPSEIILDNGDIKLQKCFISVEANMVVFLVELMKFVYLKKWLHLCRICSMTYFNTYQWLITGSEDGCIKVWDQDWNTLLVFVGHNDRIVKFIHFPLSIANLVSISTDETLRIWNLETQEEIRRIKIDKDVTILGSAPDKEELYTCSNKNLFLWKTTHLYHLFMVIGFKIIAMKLTNHPAYPQRAVIICGDFSVRIINPHTGQLITKLQLTDDNLVDIIDVVYAISEDTLFVLLKDGSLMKASTLRNPCEVKSIWTYNSKSIGFSSIVLYEHITNLTQSVNMSPGLRILTTQTIKSGIMAAPPNTNRIVLVAGRFNGEICTLDWFEGTIIFQIQAHGNQEVLSLKANPRFDQLISSGRDQVIKIWRFYSFAADCLIPLMSFYCSHTPTHMTILRNFLVVSFQDDTMLNFSLVSYDLRNYLQYDQNPICEHFDQITSLVSCPKLRILASASVDQTIKIWNETNNLIRTLQLEAIPESLCFYGEKGDLLVGMSRHIYKILHTTYLPNSYKLKLMSMNIKEPIPETIIPVDENTMDNSEYLHQYQAFKMDKFILPYPMGKTPHVTPEILLGEDKYKDAYEAFKECNNDLKTLQSGSSQQKKKTIKNVKRTAFYNYMKITNKDVGEQPNPEQEIASLLDNNEIKLKLKSITELKIRTETPESFLKKKKRPKRSKPRKEFLSEPKKPERHSISELPKRHSIYELSDHQSVDSSSSNHSTINSSIESGDYQTLSLSRKVTHLLNEYKKLSEIIMIHNDNSIHRPYGSLTSTVSRIPTCKDDSSLDIPPSKLSSSLSTIQASEMVSSLSRALSRRSNRSASTFQSHIVTEFQEHVREVLSTEWFQKHFSDISDILKNMLSSTDFIFAIIPLLNSTSMEVKINILNTIIDTFTKFGAENKDVIAQTIVNVLKEDPLESDASESDQKTFVQLAMKSLEVFHVEDDDMIMQHLKHYIYGDETVRGCAMRSLTSFGLDGSYYLSKELNEFRLEKLENTPWIDTEVQLGKWLKKWRKCLQKDISFSRRHSTKSQVFHVTFPSISRYQQRHSITADTSESKMEFPDQEVSNLDVLNYFCDTQNFNEHPEEEDLQQKEPPQLMDEPQQKDELPKTSSVVEIPISQSKERITSPKHLIRLGETYTSVCKPKRETPFYTNFKKPPITYKNYFPHQLKKYYNRNSYYLPLPKLELTPFADAHAPEKKSKKEPSLITLETLPKYFVPSMSLV